MAYDLGAFCSDDDKYTDFEAWWDPYFCCEQFFTSTAAFNTHKAIFHGPRGAGARLRFGGGGVAATGGLFGGGSGRRTGAGAGAVPTPACSTSTCAGGKKKKSKKQRQRNAESPFSPPPPGTINLVGGSSFEYSEKDKVTAQIPIPPPSSLIEDNLLLGFLEMEFSDSEHPDCGGGGSSGGGGERTERAGTVPIVAPGTGEKKKSKKKVKKTGSGGGGDRTERADTVPAAAPGTGEKKKKVKKTGTANAHVSAAPTSTTPNTNNDAFMDFLFGGSRFGGARGGGGGLLGSEPSEDNSELSDLSDIGYQVFGNYYDFMAYDDSDDFEDYEDSDDLEDYEDEDSDYEYIAYCVNKISSSNKPSSRKCTKMSGAACDDDHSCYSCKESVCSKNEYLLHMAILHRRCGACESKSQEEKKKNESGFEYEDHFKSSPDCLYNPKYKLGKVKITVIPDSEAVDNPKVKLGGVESTEIPDSKAVDNRKLKLVKVKGAEVHESKAVDRQFDCLICGENSGSGFALNEHYGTAHSKCHYCKIQFDAQDDLSKHFLNSKVHLGKYCETCKLVFSSKKSMKIHCTESHSVGTRDQIVGGAFSCDACTKVTRSFPTEEELEAHLQFEHVRCFPCKREFSQKRSLHNHLTAASQHNFCIRCDSDFVSSESFNMHDCPGNAAKNVAQKDVKRSHWVPVVPKQNGGSLDNRLLATNKAQISVIEPISAVGED